MREGAGVAGGSGAPVVSARPVVSEVTSGRSVSFMLVCCEEHTSLVRHRLRR
jgi:hypothetical protein